MRVKLTRIKGITKRMARTDDTLIGEIYSLQDPIRVGDAFTMWLSNGEMLTTTPITKIIDTMNPKVARLFETKNSLYQLEAL